MRAAVPFGVAVAGETQPGFMDERGGLEGLPGNFIRHFVRGEPAQFVVDQRKQLVRRGRLALADRVENPGHVTHSHDSPENRRRAQVNSEDGWIQTSTSERRGADLSTCRPYNIRRPAAF